MQGQSVCVLMRVLQKCDSQAFITRPIQTGCWRNEGRKADSTEPHAVTITVHDSWCVLTIW